eukprot:CAMPEP_0174893754 /NCGR_PEP_ID=MMETSP0167-20121228/8530_1 /TAXON_ID=38298 /ORGANISM="Rhodella maculata, Strain CCMP736" /LENGTH=78 /DNA_ID=CAMNT_0016132651 /DNA_START=281 /DNA_END=517 /DNA_ORIENTATION=+
MWRSDSRSSDPRSSPAQHLHALCLIPLCPQYPTLTSTRRAVRGIMMESEGGGDAAEIGVCEADAEPNPEASDPALLER